MIDTFTPTLVPDSQRVAVTARLFNVQFPLLIEPTAYSTASRLSAGYTGGRWSFYLVGPHQAFCMAPDTDQPFHVISDNGWEGDLSADGFGLCTMLFTYSTLSFLNESRFAAICAEQLHLLRDLMLTRSDARSILRAID